LTTFLDFLVSLLELEDELMIRVSLGLASFGLGLAFLAAAPSPAVAEVLALYDFDNAWTGSKETDFSVVAGNSPSVDTNSMTTASNLTNSGFNGGGYASFSLDDTAAGTSIFSTSASGSPGLNLGGANQATATNYIEFTITPNAGVQVTYESFSVYTDTSSSGDTYSVELRSVDGGGSEQSQGVHTHTPAAGNEPVHLAQFDFTDFVSTNETKWRLYAYNTANVNYGVRFDDITLNGATVPEPNAVFLGALGLLGVLGCRRRV
jgi:hypothetical protein